MNANSFSSSLVVLATLHETISIPPSLFVALCLWVYVICIQFKNQRFVKIDRLIEHTKSIRFTQVNLRSIYFFVLSVSVKIGSTSRQANAKCPMKFYNENKKNRRGIISLDDEAQCVPSFSVSSVRMSRLVVKTIFHGKCELISVHLLFVITRRGVAW